jgi:16S rRNA G1207 methylase RsmC
VENHHLNGIGTHPVQLRSTEDPSGRFDLVLIKVPKSTALLEDQLARLRPCLDASTIIIAAGMVKHLQKSAFSCFERYVGSLTTSLAHRKARLLFAQLDESRPVKPSPYPSRFHDPDVNITLVNHANVFSRDHLDHGARFLLTQFHSLPASEAAIDLGCGNGVLGIRLRQMMPAARIQFIDESYGAVASAEENYRSHFPMDDDAAEFVVADALEQRPEASADLVLCNPPFHQQHVLGDRVALSMFHGSSRCLARGGELWIVANRHLAYSRILKQVFGNCTRIAGNDKFQVLRSKKS